MAKDTLSRTEPKRRSRVSPVDRVLRKTDKNGPGGCWLFKGSLNHKGYGSIGLRPDEWGQKNAGAHRVMLAHATGGNRRDMLALHKCDVPGCVNPDHLYWGDAFDNMRDMADRRRCGKQKHPEKYRGEENGMTILTEAQVREIRAKYAAGGVFYRELAVEFGVHNCTIAQVVRRITWKHVP